VHQAYSNRAMPWAHNVTDPPLVNNGITKV